MGTTARSCMSRMEKLERPRGEASWRLSMRICITMAVEESDRQAPSTMETAGALPKPQDTGCYQEDDDLVQMGDGVRFQTSVSTRFREPAAGIG